MLQDGVISRQIETRRPTWWNVLIALPWLIGVLMLMHSCAQERAIATHQKSIDGVITAHEPQNHNRYGYQFFIDGKRHSGWEIPQKTDYKIGQKVDVYYDPQNPDKSSLTNFNELSTRSAGPVPLLLIGVGIVTFLMAKIVARSKKSASTTGIN